MTAKDIAQRSSSAVVAVEVGNAGDRGSGTGFILDKSGLIATNFHVVRGNKDIRIKLYGGEMYQVTEIAGIDPGRDLALLRIVPAKALPVVQLGDSDKMTAGDQVVAIGNPLGVFEHTVTAGLVSQVRPICTADMVARDKGKRERYEALIAKTDRNDAEDAELSRLGNTCLQELKLLQISVPISQGSSGGPLFNQAGEVVGITTLIVTEGQNINLAIPGNYLKPIVARPAAISLDEFAKRTRQSSDDDGQAKVDRIIPDHSVAVFDGCNREQVIDLVTSIWQAIEVGAPIYNKALNASAGERNTFFEACYRIYEGASNKLEGAMTCKGVKQAFGEGLKRAGGMGDDYRLKAWALRDTFDGLLKVAEKWAAANGGGSMKPKK